MTAVFNKARSHLLALKQLMLTSAGAISPPTEEKRGGLIITTYMPVSHDDISQAHLVALCCVFSNKITRRMNSNSSIWSCRVVRHLPALARTELRMKRLETELRGPV